jgi:CRISPR/Cas system-associated exonuclease Cas4 (RecB family)
MIEDNETVILSLMKEGLNYYYIDLLLPGATYQIETKENNESYLRELIPKIENVLKNGCHIKLKDKIAIIEGIS